MNRQQNPQKTETERRANSLLRRLTPGPWMLILTAAVLVLLTGVLLLAFDAFGVRTRLLSVFLSGEAEDGGVDSSPDGIPSMTRELETPARVYFGITDENALDNIVPAPYYTRVMTVTYGWGGKSTERRWTLEADGDCWRLYGDGDEIFCDGERICYSIAGFAWTAGGSDWEPEIGAVTLDELRARMNDPDYAADVTATERTVQVRTISVGHMKDLFEIDVESGLILTENSRYDNETIRTVATESLTVREHGTPREEYAERVRAFLDAHPETEDPQETEVPE